MPRDRRIYRGRAAAQSWKWVVDDAGDAVDDAGMTNEDADGLRLILREELERFTGVDPMIHASDHQWVGHERRKVARRIETVERVKQHVYGWAIVVAIIGVGRVVYLLAVDAVAKLAGGK